jgi:excisionase family DNA binding protein
MSTDRAPLFVRLPAPLLVELDARIEVDGRTKQAVVEDLLTQQLQAPPSDVVDAVDVVDLASVAELLGVSERDVLDRIALGDFPARRFGDRWRCSRTAIAAWLHGTDPIDDRRPGFTPT